MPSLITPVRHAAAITAAVLSSTGEQRQGTGGRGLPTAACGAGKGLGAGPSEGLPAGREADRVEGGLHTGPRDQGPLFPVGGHLWSVTGYDTGSSVARVTSDNCCTC